MKTVPYQFLVLMPLAVYSQPVSSEATAGGGEVVKLAKYSVVADPIIAGTTIDAQGSQVTAIAAEQLAALNAADFQGALRDTPGVIVTHHNIVGSFGGGEGGSVFIRGLGTARPGSEIQLSVDGIPSYNSVWTHPILDMLNVDCARSLTVYKGAQPVLYGNMAFAVVDLQPKFEERSGSSGRAAFSAGSFGTWSALVEGGNRTGPLDTYVVAGTRSSDGDRPDSDGRVRSLYARVGWTFNSHWDAHVIFNRTDNYADDPGPDAKLVPADQLYRNGRFADDNDLVVATLANHSESTEGYIKPYCSSGTLDWTGQYNADTLLNQDVTVTDYTNYGVKTREIVRPWEGLELLGGLDLDYITGKYRSVTGGVEDLFSRRFARLVQPYASVDERFDFGDGWSARPSLGARYFEHSIFDDELAPQAGLVVDGAGCEFHASAARGVNYPGFYVMAYPPGDNRNQELEAEKINHFEVGVSRGFGSFIKVELTGFRDQGHDRIVLSYPPYPPVWKNIGTYRTDGVEAAVTVKPSSSMSLFGGVTAMRATPGDLPYVPKAAASVGFNWRFSDRFHFSADGQYVGARSVMSRDRSIDAVNTVQLGSYVLINARLSYEWPLPAWHLSCECFVAGENLGDVSYQQQYGYPMPGRNGSAGVSVKF